VELTSLEQTLRDLTLAEIRTIARELEDVHTSPADEIAATRAILGVEQSLRTRHLQTQAAIAARHVGAAVQEAATRGGLTLPDDDVTRVARAAGQVARAVIAGAAADGHLHVLARGMHLVVRPNVAVSV
jgi:hypothetical protein